MSSSFTLEEFPKLVQNRLRHPSTNRSGHTISRYHEGQPRRQLPSSVLAKRTDHSVLAHVHVCAEEAEVGEPVREDAAIQWGCFKVRLVGLDTQGDRSANEHSGSGDLRPSWPGSSSV